MASGSNKALSRKEDRADGDPLLDGAALVRDLLPADLRRLYIGGRWRDGGSGRHFSVYDPATGGSIAEVSDGTVDDAGLALDAAVQAQAEWARSAPGDRARLLAEAAHIVRQREDDFALLMTLEMGKPLAEARAEVAYGASFLSWFATEATRITGRLQTSRDGLADLVVEPEPVGPCLLITPWNFPLAMATRKIGPAIAAGCTMVVKPAALTPLTTLLLTRIFEEVGLPPGVLNVVTTTNAAGVTSPLLADSRLRKVSFTGSTSVGRTLLRAGADNVLRTSMELGGDAPFIVFDDADLEQAVDAAVAAKLRNMGEACTAANRLLVQEGIAADFEQALAQRFSGLTLGHGALADSDVGPLITVAARQEIHGLVEAAADSGARVLTGGQIPEGPGAFYPPTVVTDVPRDSKLWQSEIFGPVAAISTFGTEDEAVDLANDTLLGLAGYVISGDTARAVRVARKLQCGMVGINTGVVSDAAAPFGGVKQSGLGREGSLEGIEEYQTLKYMKVPRQS
ncbi:NAD-dependent succinate-semialdehyde dehydrogenase [Streptomyces sp. TG1A-8]|uniref:NAD-dependent succinate-semialdehyde dehydrogenase n=1 Tax=Streptomyces sp. TG1A-8 TaxID=3051385 RepID=UPI00265C2657|nr:NAD-dependent succinate-semialdehyde dehydrogenase [Streptomyces sp. TG1A-8]MDO0929649.1 NAD-dependent succinate-semialdehyde dehydrogenase [Streptomyces sp. TG1A-8]